VNIADLAAFETWPGYIPTGISKSGVVYLTRAPRHGARARRSRRGDRDRARSASRRAGARRTRALRQTTPLAREGSPEDVARTMLFILDSDYLTGETIIVDGGRHVRR
jgi:NAD(P)-dependent dehydrogenase (short-subunit alcohol dehydrogenase family)